MDRFVVVMSGLPASGKTTLGNHLAAELGLPFIDKDNILVGLFDAYGVNDPDERSRLSRLSDETFEQLVRSADAAVVATFWRRDGSPSSSGTPTDWLRDLPGRLVVEVLCECRPEVAAERFDRRQRHPGHFDGRVDAATRLAGFERLASAGPVTNGPLVRVDTESPVDVLDVCAKVRSFRRG
jgi:predicted kinase